MKKIIKINDTAYQIKITNKLEIVVSAKSEKEAFKKIQKYIKRKEKWKKLLNIQKMEKLK